MNDFATRVCQRKEENARAKARSHAKLVRDIQAVADSELRKELMAAYNIPEQRAIEAAYAA